MKRYMYLFAIVAISLFNCKQTQDTLAKTTTETEDTYVQDNYDKKEVMIEMRDGIKLHTTIYSPKDTSKEYPIIMMRTPYSCRPYGADEYRSKIGPNTYLMEEGNIIVYQDVRGRWNSEGVYDNMRAYIPNKTGNQTDEASDTYDTIEWLINNVDNNNGRVGTWGISYPGFYATYSVLSGHPALKASSPQACIGDFFFDDFIHNGAFLLSYWRATSVFGYMKDTPTTEAWYNFPDIGTEDQYQFFLDAGPLSNLDKYYDEDNVFYQQIKTHTTYDAFWQSRGIIQHLKDIKPATLIVGGLFDAEDLYGPFNTYQSIEEHSDNYNAVVFGPWSHGDWARTRERQVIGNIHFGDNISDYFQKNIETPFFNHFLKGNGEGEPKLAEAQMFDTGKKEWVSFDSWPPANATKESYFMQPYQKLTQQANRMIATSDFVSDPKKPVPYSEDVKVVFTPRKFMTDDQRFTSRRPDVLTFETQVLDKDMTLAGDILAKLNVSTTGTAADWIVKVVDVFPSDTENTDDVQDHLKLSNYHMLVRSEVMRGRFRNSMTNPEPFVPNEKTAVNIELQDVFHTFKKGHKIQIQVQSTFFPYIDANPQTYVDNIFEATEADFQAQTHKVFNDSSVEFTVLK
ncbi:CocE/NonD family hydrolase [Psychroserpens sp.]|uniref:CocE/NonD family hydrolase n=1 Tax=Psychroserpens sp. TaxID=2020870 RepID=UPI001B02F53B|nr:CocE/NonD family hydrolase [Psychroserpens sp.]MBO6606724.1 CocE/NonD family hydrolase [Psychroserpens sp.]MBO6630771.1 CocE/NonD family hydrolase [Psychroserpens sp.]MBO6653428.1 CocE/NonD family hydrolase [Psychroserpens sp.]MBO6680545.1 CocE/NonD family hydrolase [Psychroserpens sp.]MBO6750497.1 CocE/NonD family hydrolase [Psychroserpens sp.]